MRRLLRLLTFFVALLSGTSLLGQNIELTLRYNLALSRFEVLARPDATITGFTWGPSQVTIVVPASVPNSALAITSVNGGAWLDNSRVYAPAADPAHDFHGVGSLGAITDLVSGQEVLLFHFKLPVNDCTPGLRLFINGSDPDSEAPGMLGGDFANTIDNGQITDVYAGNYNNIGTDSSPRDTISATICANETYTFGGQPLSVAGTYQDTLTAANGCDSIVTLNLNVLPISRDTISASICEGETYTFGNQTLSVAGTYSDTLVAANTCDSIITLNLMVRPIIRDTISASICEGETYTFGSQTLSVVGTYADTLVAANACDSIVTLNLTVRPIIRDTISASICEGETYTFGSQTLSVAGTYSDTLVAANACDSIVTLNLTVRPIIRDTISASICEGETYTFGSQTLSAAGTYSDTLVAANACDSIVTLNLTIRPVIRDTISASICEGETYTFGSQTLSVAGTYADTLVAANACDSIVTLNLTVRPIIRDTISASICEGETYTFGSQTLSVAGTYSDTLTAANACDSIVTLNLTIRPIIRDTISASICEGETYTFGSQTLSAAGIYSDTLVAAAVNGCDSIINLELIVRPVSRDTLNVAICAGETYTFGSQTLSVAGTYMDTLTAANACDSIVVLNLNVNPVFQDTLVVSINEGSTYTFGGQALDSTGTYIDTLSTVNGCDSIVVLELTVIPTTGILQLKVMLQGALFNTLTPGVMRDDLRTGNYIPLNDPYTSSGNTKFSHFGSGGAASTSSMVLSANAGTGNAIVDWVFVELRSAADSKVILETRAALLQRDGDVVSPVDGTSALRFMGLAGNSCFVAIKHRNHLGAMTAAPQTLTTSGTTVDFTTMADAAVFNNNGFDGVEMITVGSVKALWAGNANADNKVKYQGTANDNATILSQVLTHPGNTGGVYNYNSGFGYYGGDINMDGKVKYQGSGNDPNFIFFNVITAYPLNVGDLYNYDLFREQLPL